MRVYFCCILFLFTFTITSCGEKRVNSSIRSALSDISYESDFINTNLIRYRNFISLNGLVTQHVPGMYFHQPSGKSTAPTLSIGISPFTSYMVTSTVMMKEKADKDKLITFGQIVKDYSTARSQSINLTADQFRLQLLDFLLIDINSKLKSSIETNTIDGNKLPDWAKESPALAGIDFTDIKKDDGSYKSLSDIRNKLLVKQSTLNLKVKTKMKEYDELVDKLHNKISNNRILFIQWKAETTRNTRYAIPGISQFNQKKHRQTAGILILGDVKLQSLFVGIDFRKAIQSASSWNSSLLGEVGISSYTLYAKYSQSIVQLNYTKALSLSLNFSISNLQSLKKLQAAINSGKLDLSLTYSIAQKLNQISVNYNMKTRVSPYTFYPTKEHLKCINLYLNQSSGYHTVMAVRVHMKKRMIDAISSNVLKSQLNIDIIKNTCTDTTII